MIFNIGDRIKITSSRYEGLGEIVALRHTVGNTRTGDLSFGADILTGEGRVIFFFMHDLARWNSEKLTVLK